MSTTLEPYFSDGQVTLFHGDCVEVLKTLPENSIDAVVCDPPYGLEFMGKDWDAPWKQADALTTARMGRDELGNVVEDPAGEGGFQDGANVNAYEAGRPFQAWCETWAAECLRVLKPGGHILAFGGSRTWHRLAAAIEDAGFEIRDSIAWLYGCLTADTEILTDTGWRHGVDVAVGDLVAQWDHATGRINLAPVEGTFRAPWDGPMRVLRNADTDQVLTPNHRVYHNPVRRKMIDGRRVRWYDDGWQVSEAGHLSTWNPFQLPIAGEHDGPGIGGADYAALLGWVWTEGGFDLSGTGVRIYQSSVNAPKVDEIAALLDRLTPHKRYDQQRNWQGRPYTATTWFFSGVFANRVRADLPGKRPTYDLLWRMTGAEKRAFLRAAMLGDGSAGSQQFYQKHEDDLVWLQTLLALIGRSGKIGMRTIRDGGALYLRKRATTELQARHLRDATTHYTGEVWCVKVQTGAFVARRNGRIFITGNSGFPKSRDVTEAMNRYLAGEVAESPIRPGLYDVTGFLRDARDRAGWSNTQIDELFGTHGMAGHWTSQASQPACPSVRQPACPSVRQWEILKAKLGFGDDMDGLVAELAATERPEDWGSGASEDSRFLDTLRKNGDFQPAGDWGSALKPAFEPIVVGRKPIRASLTANVLQHGTGALHIGACRTEGDMSTGRWGGTQKAAIGDGGGTDDNGYQTQQHPGGRWPTNVLFDEHQGAELDKQSGVSSSRRAELTSTPGSIYGDGKGLPSHTGIYGYNDAGGASRYFPTFKYTPKAATSERPSADGVSHPTVKPVSLLRWLIRLVTPPHGTVLDPFGGSGTTGEAAIHEHMRAILIEREPTYLPLIVARLSKPMAIGFDFDTEEEPA